MRHIAILGAGGFAQQAAWCLRRAGDFTISAMIDELRSEPDTWEDIPVLPALTGTGLQADDVELISAVGNAGLRRRWAEALGARYRFATLIDPSALHAPSASICAGSMLLPGAICSTNVEVGCHTIVGMRAALSHDTKVGSFSFLASGVIANGHARIGDECMIGAGAVLLPGVEIGSGATVGAGAVVAQSVASGETVAGVPARPLGAPRF